MRYSHVFLVEEGQPRQPEHYVVRDTLVKMLPPYSYNTALLGGGGGWKPGQSLMILRLPSYLHRLACSPGTCWPGTCQPTPSGFCRDTFRPPAGTVPCAKQSPTKVYSTCTSYFAWCCAKVPITRTFYKHATPPISAAGSNITKPLISGNSPFGLLFYLPLHNIQLLLRTEKASTEPFLGAPCVNLKPIPLSLLPLSAPFLNLHFTAQNPACRLRRELRRLGLASSST